ncbi:MAG: hypothetical protein GY832_23330 [Chloroflexi bacterium]|nr:hypothetical protein [Chloroflexota bacterium]
MTHTHLSDQISSDELGQTTITAHLESEIVSGKNLLYCAAFQLAWNQLGDDILGSNVQLEGDPDIAQALNRRLVNKEDIAENCYLAMAGFNRDGIVKRIEQTLEKKFGRSPGVSITLQHPNDFLAYAFLEKSLPFDTEFEVFEVPLVFSDGAELQSFGIEKDNTPADQVVILDYRHPDDFVLKLQASEKADEMLDLFDKIPDQPRITDDIILAKVTPQATLLETIDTVMSRTSEEAREQARRAAHRAGKRPFELLSPKLDLNRYEALQIPKINLNILHGYTELVGRDFLNKGFEGYYITKALQAIQFKLDEKGADLRSDAAIYGTLGAIEEPRRFIFDKPFLLCLKEKMSRYPYLAIWVGNSELLVQAQ